MRWTEHVFFGFFGRELPFFSIKRNFLKESPTNPREWDFRLVVSLTAILGLLAVFWLGSRYPALNEKAMMGGDTGLSGLAFDIVLDIFPNSSLWWQLVANTANWIATNLKGMTFGVLFGATILTVLPLIKTRSFSNTFANAALGTVIGVPLGVCVNCAVPITLGLHMGRMRLETTLAALLASPTLNIIVVTMSFALLPFHVAATKLGLALAMVLVVVPLLCKLVLVSESRATGQSTRVLATLSDKKGLTVRIARALAPIDSERKPSGFGGALIWFFKVFTRNLAILGVITVPMMFLAAFMGAVVVTAFDANELAQILPRSGIAWTIIGMFLLALVASFVPAPIALDVILTSVLLSVGLLTHYGAVMVIALGSFSIYAFIILWRAISPKTAIVLWSAVIFMAMGGGVISKLTQKYERQFIADRLLTILDQSPAFDFPQIPALPEAARLEDFQDIIDDQRVAWENVEVEVTSNRGSSITVQRAAFESAVHPEGGSDEPVFARIPGQELGFEDIGIATPARMFAPEIHLGGIAAGDIHNDGWNDIVVRRPTGGRGLSLYANLRGRFQRQHLDLGPVAEMYVLNVALADLDNDGWQDLVVTTKANGNYVFFNDDGNFRTENLLHIPVTPGAQTMALAFADLDRDQGLDLIFGNWVVAPNGREFWFVTPTASLNAVAWNAGNRQFNTTPIAGSPGQTLTLLVSDVNGDGVPDILKGDDFVGTDEFIFVNPGRETYTSLEEQPFPYYMRTSMSYDTGDWNNDLIPDYYGVQISDTGFSGNRLKEPRRLFEICQQFANDLSFDLDWTRECADAANSIIAIRGSFSDRLCNGPLRTSDMALCAISNYTNTLVREVYVNETLDPNAAEHQCATELSKWTFAVNWCENFAIETHETLTGQALAALHMPFQTDRNILMTGTVSGDFEDQAQGANVASPGWSWNSRFTDLDQDGWQDLLVMTGIWMAADASPSNVFFRNIQGRFEDATDVYGFSDVVPSFSYALVDYDRDGDIDVIRPPEGMTTIVHRNDQPAGLALWVNLEDHKGNRDGIGARVTICLDGVVDVVHGACQMRDIKASGGYMSFDPIAAHFGLGNALSVSLIEVIWLDGEVTRVLPSDLRSAEINIIRQ